MLNPRSSGNPNMEESLPNPFLLDSGYSFCVACNKKVFC